MHFDWYQATVKSSPEALKEQMRALPGVSVLRSGFGPGHGYTDKVDALDQNEVVIASMLCGGRQWPNVRGSGQFASLVADWLRGANVEHKVSRVDVAHDQDDVPGLFDRWQPLVANGAKRGHVRSRHLFLPDDPEMGRTYYAGAKTSPSMVRLYEKGLQLRKSGLEVSRDWVRLELQWRPQKGAKQVGSKLSPEQVWGVTTWTRLVAEACIKRDVSKVDLPPVLSQLDETFGHCLNQYAMCMMRVGAREMRREGIVPGCVDPDDAIDAVLSLVGKNLRERFCAPQFDAALPWDKQDEILERFAEQKALWDPKDRKF